MHVLEGNENNGNMSNKRHRKYHRPKLKDVIYHAKKRAWERFGLSLNNDNINDIVKVIQKNEAKFIDRESLRVSRWLLDVSGVTVVAVYDKTRKTIITFLSPEMLNL